MKKPETRNVWLKLTVGLGSALGVLLLVQSIVTYFQASKDLVTEELERDAGSRVTAVDAARKVNRDALNFLPDSATTSVRARADFIWGFDLADCNQAYLIHVAT